MNRRNILSLSAIVASALAVIPGSAMAQQKSLKDQLVGTWTVVSWEQVAKDRTKLQRFGATPKGVNVFNADGRFYVMFARSDLPKLASSNPMKTTPEESKAIAEGSIAYFGTYTIDEAGRTVSLQVEASTFPNQVGAEQKRTIGSISANELKITNQAITGAMISYVMKRATTVASK